MLYNGFKIGFLFLVLVPGASITVPIQLHIFILSLLNI